MDLEWQMFAVHLRPGSGVVVELVIFVIAALVLRRAFNEDRAGAAAPAPVRRPLLGGLLRTPTAIAGTSGDSLGHWPRLSFLIRAVLFTAVLEAVMSHRASDIYLDVLPALRTPYQYPDLFLVNIFDVPLWVPVGWAVIFYLSMTSSDRLIPVGVEYATDYRTTWLRGGLARALMDALFALSLDFALDPVATAEGWWRWTPRIGAVEFFSVPISNFVAWFAIIFLLSLLVRTSRIFGLGAPDPWPLVARLLFQVVGAIVPLVISFLGVLALVLSIYALDARGSVFGVNSAFVIGAIVAVASVIVIELTLPFAHDHPHDRLVVSSTVVLHVVFFGSMIWNVFGHQSAGAASVQLVPISSHEVGRVVDAVRTNAVVTDASGKSVAVDIPGGLDLVATNTHATGADLDPASTAHAVFAHQHEVLLVRAPELSLWVPIIASVSVFLVSWPYFDDLARRARGHDRRPFWILRLLLGSDTQGTQ